MKAPVFIAALLLAASPALARQAEAPAAPETATPVEALPPDQRSSEETVQPESDTLFY